MKRIKKVVLCDGRHDVPQATDGAIFPHTVRLSDLHEVDEVADRFVCQCHCNGDALQVYCTGVQYPLVAVINACLKRDVKLTLMHFDPNTKTYYPQQVYQE